MTTEESVRKKLKRKIRTTGADMNRIMSPDFASDKAGVLRELKFGSKEMADFIRYYKPTLCVFDPVQGFVPPDVNMGSRNAMRDCLAPLISLGEETNTTFLIVAHTNKRKGAYGRDRIADSADLWDISRSVLMMGYTEDQGIRYISQEKSNYGELSQTHLFSFNRDGNIVPEGTSWKRDREYQLEANTNASPTACKECEEWILQTLTQAGGEMLTKDLETKAKEEGFKNSTLRRAKDHLKENAEIRYYQTGAGTEKAWHIKRIVLPSAWTS